MIESGFFDSVSADRLYNADSFNDFLSGILTDTGVYEANGNGLQVIPNESMSVTVQTGRGRIKGKWFSVQAPETVEISASDLTLSRTDAIVFKLDENLRQITLEVYQGTPGNGKPSIVQSENVTSICIAYINVPPAASAITEEMIEDSRSYTNVCGFVKLQIGTVNTRLKEYKQVTTAKTQIGGVVIDIPEYNFDNDILIANINGVMLSEERDYSISNDGDYYTLWFNGNTIESGNTIEIRIIKSIVEIA